MNGFDEVVHVPTRLRICALLARVSEVEFGIVRDALELSDSVLSKHLKVLESAGYVELRKGLHNTRTRTWVALTPAGLRAFRGHLAALTELAAGVTLT